MAHPVGQQITTLYRILKNQEDELNELDPGAANFEARRTHLKSEVKVTRQTLIGLGEAIKVDESDEDD